jgi:opacity protein-like surface antigen
MIYIFILEEKIKMKNFLFGLVAAVTLAGAASADVLDVRVPMDKATSATANKLQFGTLYNATTNETQFAVVTKVDAVKLPKVLNRQFNVVAGLTSGRNVNSSVAVVYGVDAHVYTYKDVKANVGVAWNTPITGGSAWNVSSKPGLMVTLSKKL